VNLVEHGEGGDDDREADAGQDEARVAEERARTANDKEREAETGREEQRLEAQPHAEPHEDPGDEAGRPRAAARAGREEQRQGPEMKREEIYYFRIVNGGHGDPRAERGHELRERVGAPGPCEEPNEQERKDNRHPGQGRIRSEAQEGRSE